MNILKALFVEVRKTFMHVVMVSQSGRDINPEVDEGDFMTGQSMGPPTSMLVCCIFYTICNSSRRVAQPARG